MVAASFYAMRSQGRGDATEMAQNVVRAYLLRDQAFRMWVSDKGGLYAEVGPNTQPVPFMSHVPNPDVRTEDGVALTLLNPATMLREMMDRYASVYGARSRIVGVVTINPANRANPWEEEAIKAFERGETERSEVTEGPDGLALRVIRPLKMTESCMKCHGHLGFVPGDIRGAVTISLPLDEYLASADKTMSLSGRNHVAFWLLGLVGRIFQPPNRLSVGNDWRFF